MSVPAHNIRPPVRIVGFSGNWARPSRTRTLVQAVLDEASARVLANVYA